MDTQHTPDPADWFTVREIAAAAGVTMQTVRNWITSGILVRGQRVRLAIERVGGRVRIPAAAYRAFRAALNLPPK